MTEQKSSQKKMVIGELLGLKQKLDKLLAELLPACPECCPPIFPAEPGEVLDYGRGQISVCENCCGRGYLLPNEDNNE